MSKESMAWLGAAFWLMDTWRCSPEVAAAGATGLIDALAGGEPQ